MLKAFCGVRAFKGTLAGLCLTGLGGCGGEPATTPTSSPTPMPTATSSPEPTPSPSASVAATPVSQAAPSCELAAPATCLGPLGLIVENVGLRWGGPASPNGSRRVGTVATVRIESRSDDPVHVALLDQPVRVQFANGLTLEDRFPGNTVTGVQICGDTGTECLNRGRDRFSTLSARGQSLRLEIALEQTFPADVAALAPASEKASISAALWVISASPEGEGLSLSLAADRIINSTRQ